MRDRADSAVRADPSPQGDVRRRRRNTLTPAWHTAFFPLCTMTRRKSSGRLTAEKMLRGGDDVLPGIQAPRPAGWIAGLISTRVTHSSSNCGARPSGIQLLSPPTVRCQVRGLRCGSACRCAGGYDLMTSLFSHFISPCRTAPHDTLLPPSSHGPCRTSTYAYAACGEGI